MDEEINFAVGNLPRGTCSTPLITGVTPQFVSDCGLTYTPNTFNEDECEGEFDESEDWWFFEDSEDELESSSYRAGSQIAALGLLSMLAVLLV